MSKYAPLADHLKTIPGQQIPMTFAEIERALGFPLPASKVYQAWWSNSPSNNPMTRVWLDAGFRTESVDTGREKLVFRRGTRSAADSSWTHPRGVEEPAEAFDRRQGFVERIQARLAGTVTIAPGVDLCEPTGEIWDAER